MDTKYLLPNEEIITKSEKNIVTLTNYRIRYSDIEFGKAHIVSILLEKVSSVEVHYRSKVTLLYLAVILGLAGLVLLSSNESIAILSLVGSGLSFIFYALSRKHYLTIESVGSNKINFQIQGMKRDMILKFVNQVEEAVKERMDEFKRS